MRSILGFTIKIEKDNSINGYFGKVPSLRGCYTQGKTLTELYKNLEEAILLCLEVREMGILKSKSRTSEFIGKTYAKAGSNSSF